MQGRVFSSGSYRYGFNGKEKLGDEAIDWQDYGFRIFNYRLARFISVDPITRYYPELTPYQFASNMPAWGVDLDGLEFALPIEPMVRPITIPRILPPTEITVTPIGPVCPPGNTPVPLTQTNIKPVDINWQFDIPADPSSLSEDWEEKTDPRNTSGRREFTNKKTGNKIEFDKGRPGEPGWRGKNHWHRINPSSKGKMDKYLDRNGNPVPDGSNASHIEAPKIITLSPVQIRTERPNWFNRKWNNIKKWFKEDSQRREYDSLPEQYKG